MNLKRRMVLKEAPDRQGPVFYWMSREQRAKIPPPPVRPSRGSVFI